jgi:hypothetical protein
VRRPYFLPSFLLASLLLSGSSFAQNLGGGEIHGNFQTDVQYYRPDSLIGAPVVPEKVLMNGFANLIYTKGNFSAGLRYESYLNALQGFDTRYQGNGIPYRYATYTTEGMEVTVGNYYDQFGSGLIFRSYEERGLGWDNSLDGIRLKMSPLKGLYLKGIYGKQRSFFTQGPGIVRGGDAEIAVNEIYKPFADWKSRINIGGSVISKYQPDLDPVYNLPENVAAFAGRAGVTRGKTSYYAEYAYKINDPSSVNNYKYNPGEAFLLTASYSDKGIGFSVGAKRVNNMNFRSDRTAIGNNLHLNFLPPIARQHTYQLLTIYPYATQPNGEMGVQADFFYTFRPGTPIGGKYGTNIALNMSRVNNIDSVSYNDDRGYSSGFSKIGKELYFQDFNIEINKKISKDLKAIFTHAYVIYNEEVIEGHVDDPNVHAQISVLDLTYKFNAVHSLRTELQSLVTSQDKGNWAMALLEYTISPHWFFTVLDQYNYGNPVAEQQIHYYNSAVGYTRNALRVMLGYGKQRAGILCVGGICRTVPASNGLTLSITNSF